MFQYTVAYGRIRIEISLILEEWLFKPQFLG
jgi:hypothetical protein